MKIKTDAFGQALLDYLKGERNQKITVISNIAEDDVIPVNYLFRTGDELPEIETTALALCKGKVLDVGAGSGVHALLLQKKGLDVNAIDISEGAVNSMLQQGVKEVTQVNFYDVVGGFDTLLFLMNGVGIAGTLEGLKLFLNKAKELLNEGGQILLDSSDISYMFKEEDGSMWVDLNTSYYGEVVYQMQYKDFSTTKFNWLFVDFLTLEKIANDLGFKAKLVLEGEKHHYLARLSL